MNRIDRNSLNRLSEVNHNDSAGRGVFFFFFKGTACSRRAALNKFPGIRVHQCFSKKKKKPSFTPPCIAYFSVISVFFFFYRHGGFANWVMSQIKCARGENEQCTGREGSRLENTDPLYGYLWIIIILSCLSVDQFMRFNVFDLTITSLPPPLKLFSRHTFACM